MKKMRKTGIMSKEDGVNKDNGLKMQNMHRKLSYGNIKTKGKGDRR